MIQVVVVMVVNLSSYKTNSYHTGANPLLINIIRKHISVNPEKQLHADLAA